MLWRGELGFSFFRVIDALKESLKTVLGDEMQKG